LGQFFFFLFGPGRFNYDYRKASLWAENCPNFLAGTSPKGAGKTEVFFREFFLSQTSPSRGFDLPDFGKALLGRENY
jgi:hypothetical protein